MVKISAIPVSRATPSSIGNLTNDGQSKFGLHLFEITFRATIYVVERGDIGRGWKRSKGMGRGGKGDEAPYFPQAVESRITAIRWTLKSLCRSLYWPVVVASGAVNGFSSCISCDCADAAVGAS